MSNKRVSVVVEATDTISDIIKKLEMELEPSEVELNQLKEEKALMQKRELELTKNVEELNEANKNAAKALAATYDEKAFETYITWQDALKKGFVNPGELVFHKGKMYTVISPTGTNKDMAPDISTSAYLDITDSIDKSKLKKEKPKGK